MIIEKNQYGRYTATMKVNSEIKFELIAFGDTLTEALMNCFAKLQQPTEQLLMAKINPDPTF